MLSLIIQPFGKSKLQPNLVFLLTQKYRPTTNPQNPIFTKKSVKRYTIFLAKLYRYVTPTFLSRSNTIDLSS